MSNWLMALACGDQLVTNDGPWTGPVWAKRNLWLMTWNAPRQLFRHSWMPAFSFPVQYSVVGLPGPG